MVRSILLRGFDQDMAGKIGDHMEKHGVNFTRDTVPVQLTKTKEGKVLVKAENSKTKQVTEQEYDTVLFAIGRYAVTNGLNLDKIGVKLEKNGKVAVNEFEQSSVENIYSLGDCAEGRPELTPPAIKAGQLLARRLYADYKLPMDYINIATTVFTPLEYGACGLSEEDAKKK